MERWVGDLTLLATSNVGRSWLRFVLNRVGVCVCVCACCCCCYCCRQMSELASLVISRFDIIAR